MLRTRNIIIFRLQCSFLPRSPRPTPINFSLFRSRYFLTYVRRARSTQEKKNIFMYENAHTFYYTYVYVCICWRDVWARGWFRWRLLLRNHIRWFPKQRHCLKRIERKLYIYEGVANAYFHHHHHPPPTTLLRRNPINRNKHTTHMHKM